MRQAIAYDQILMIHYRLHTLIADKEGLGTPIKLWEQTADAIEQLPRRHMQLTETQETVSLFDHMRRVTL
jgi:hypothetical protein